MSILPLLSVLSIADPAYPVCNAAVCPERANDLVWENDKFGMRAYGPGEYHKWSGFDVFNKNTASNVCIRWTRDANYNHPEVTPNFHQNLGEGMDNYTMGASRGVGGIALFGDGEWKTYPDWESSEIIHTGPDFCEFVLVYPAFSAAGKMTCHITLKRGEHFFRNDVSFERMPPDFLAGPGLDLEPRRGHGGSLCEGEGAVSLFEDPKGRDGSTMAAVFVRDPAEVESLTDNQNCRVLAFRGRKSFTYWAGAGWSSAGGMTTAEAWHRHVREFQKRLSDTGDNAFGNWPSGTEPETIGRRVVEQFLSAPPEAYAPKGANAYHGEGKVMPYAIVSLWVNAIDFALTTGDAALVKRLTDHFEPFFDEKIHLVPVPNHVDFSVFGALPYAVYRANGDERCLDLGEYFATMQWAKPLKGAPPRFVHGGHNLPWEERLDLWNRGYTAETRFWIDDMYMITLLQTEGARATGKAEYVERAAKETALYLEKLQKPNGLFEHGLKAPFFWCRGNGWVAGGMALILKHLPESSPYRAPILSGYRRMMAELLKYQKPDGLWAQLVNEPEVWSETSGSAMFASALTTGVKRGWLDAATYGPAARRAYLGLLKHLDADGNIDEVCMGTGAHDDHAFYLARPRKIGDAHGQAALMWTVNALLTK